MVEMDEEYCLYGEKRLRMAENDSTIQGYYDRVFWERNTLKEIRKKKKSDSRKMHIGTELSLLKTEGNQNI